LKIQQTYSFILILQILMCLSSLLAIIWALLINCSYIPFLLLLLISIFIFVSIYISNNKFKILELDKKSCILSIFITWILLILMGAIPLYIVFPEENIRDIFFLSVSLSTTSGIWTEINTINNPEFLIWQAILQWLGGLCTILVGSFFVEMVLRKKNIVKNYFSIENIKIIFYLFLSFTIIFTILFKLLSNSWSNSIQLSMALISTSNAYLPNGNIIVESNIMIKIVMIFAMIVGSLSINLHYKSFTQGILTYFRNKSFKLAFLLIFSITFFITMVSFNNIQIPFYEKYVDISFLIISFISTTGLIPNNLYQYGDLTNLLLILALLCLVGGAVSSTTGGLKPTRILYIYKYISLELFKLGNPRKVIAKEKIKSIDEISQIFIFTILYLAIIPVLASIMSIFNINFEEAFLIVVSTLSNTGIGLLEIANINYYPETFMEVIFLSIILLFGRVEIFITMILISSIFWKKI
jgi:trk system potassium uptake protein TrkH